MQMSKQLMPSSARRQQQHTRHIIVMAPFSFLFKILYFSLLPILRCSAASSTAAPFPSQQRAYVSSNNLLLQLRGGSTTTTRLSSSSSSSSNNKGWERMDGKDLLGKNKNNNKNNSLRSSLLSVTGDSSTYGRRACGFYMWDAPSALFHKWCHHLLKDCIYEGLGGRKFVRIEPGSILQLLYPCSRYSPDRCVLCGGSYRDHLTLWWAKNLYTPFDQYIDSTHASGVVLEPKYPGAIAASKVQRRRRRRRRRYNRSNNLPRTRRKSKRSVPSNPKVNLSEMRKIFAFHKNYVLDLETLVEGVTDKQERAKKLRKEVTKIQQKTEQPVEVRMLMDRKKAYLVPAAATTTSKPTTTTSTPKSSNNNNNNSKSKPSIPQQQQRGPSVTLFFTRYLFLNAVDRLIGIQEVENEMIRKKEQQASGICCP